MTKRMDGYALVDVRTTTDMIEYSLDDPVAVCSGQMDANGATLNRKPCLSGRRTPNSLCHRRKSHEQLWEDYQRRLLQVGRPGNPVVSKSTARLTNRRRRYIS